MRLSKTSCAVDVLGLEGGITVGTVNCVMEIDVWFDNMVNIVEPCNNVCQKSDRSRFVSRIY